MTEWCCKEVPEWKEGKCCPYCHAKNERSFSFQIKGLVKRVCCKYSLSFLELHKSEEILFLDEELLLTPGL